MTSAKQQRTGEYPPQIPVDLDDPNLQPKKRTKSYIVSSWRGERSLAVSYWINGFLITFLLQIFVGIYNSGSILFSDAARTHVRTYYACGALLEMLVIAISIWQTVGIWRAASHHKLRTGRRFIPSLAQVVVAMTAIASFGKIAGLKEYYSDVFWNALGKDPLGSYHLKISDDKKRLTVSGVLSYGLASDVDEVMATNSNIELVVLNSDGGRIWEAENLYDVLKKKSGLRILSESGCRSACTIPFLAGAIRSLKDNEPLLGFHSSSSPYYIRKSVDAENRRIHSLLVSHGISSAFASKALSTSPTSMWYPSFSVLRDEGIVNELYLKESQAPVAQEISKRRDVTGTPASVSTTRSSARTPSSARRTAPVEPLLISGVVVETMIAGSYTYVLVDDGEKKIWAAAPQFAVNKGDLIAVPEGMPMSNYRSTALNRSFDVIYFVGRISNAGTSSATTVDGPTQEPSSAESRSGLPQQTATDRTISFTGIRKADLTVSEVYNYRNEVGGKVVAVRGKAVMFSAGIMGRNWLHVQDGTGRAGANDLVVTTDDGARVGDTVLVSGTITLNKDFGMGYKYDLIMEDGTVSVE